MSAAEHSPSSQKAIWTGSLKRLGAGFEEFSSNHLNPGVAAQQRQRRSMSLIQAAIYYDTVETLDQIEFYPPAARLTTNQDQVNLTRVVSELAETGVIQHTWAEPEERGDAFDEAVQRTMNWVLANGALLRERRESVLRTNRAGETDAILGSSSEGYRKLPRHQFDELFDVLCEVDAEAWFEDRPGSSYLMTDRLVCRQLAGEVGATLTQQRDSALLLPDVDHVLSVTDATSRPRADDVVLHNLVAEVIPHFVPESAGQIMDIRERRSELIAVRELIAAKASELARSEKDLSPTELVNAVSELWQFADEAYEALIRSGPFVNVADGLSVAVSQSVDSINLSGIPLNRFDTAQFIGQALVCFVTMTFGRARDDRRRLADYEGGRLLKELIELGEQRRNPRHPAQRQA